MLFLAEKPSYSPFKPFLFNIKMIKTYLYSKRLYCVVLAPAAVLVMLEAVNSNMCRLPYLHETFLLCFLRHTAVPRKIQRNSCPLTGLALDFHSAFAQQPAAFLYVSDADMLLSYSVQSSSIKASAIITHLNHNFSAQPSYTKKHSTSAFLFQNSVTYRIFYKRL